MAAGHKVLDVGHVRGARLLSTSCEAFVVGRKALAGERNALAKGTSPAAGYEAPAVRRDARATGPKARMRGARPWLRGTNPVALAARLATGLEAQLWSVKPGRRA